MFKNRSPNFYFYLIMALTLAALAVFIAAVFMIPVEEGATFHTVDVGGVKVCLVEFQRRFNVVDCTGGW